MGKKWVLLAVLLLLSLVGCKTLGEEKPQEEVPVDKVEETLAAMSLPEKVGQMVMIGIHGTEANEDSAFMLSQYHIGGVILFDRNLQDAEQTKALTRDLRKQADKKAPLFIGIDEEGGQVVRGKAFIAPPPAPYEVGLGEPIVAEQIAQNMGMALKNIGINVNFAPVADVAVDGRSFSSDPARAAAFVAASGRGYAAAGELFVLKHFPGIGKGTQDSHQDISSITASKERLRKEDLLPFAHMIKNAPQDSYFILTSHLLYPALSNAPASQSKEILTELLREEMGYDGVIITDDMEMGAAAKYDTFANLGRNAVKAGADIVLVCHEYAHEKEVYRGILEAARAGEIPEEQINASVRRILRAKYKQTGEI